MAEATLAPETEVTPPNDDALLTPDSTAEDTPPADNQEEDSSHIDALLEELGKDDAATAGDDGKAATADGLVPAPEQKLTPEEAKEEGRREKEAEIEARRVSEERKRYLDGMAFVVGDVPEKLKQFVKDYGLDVDAADRLTKEFNRLNGAIRPLFEHALEQQRPQIESQAYQRAEAEVSKHLLDAIAEDLGEGAQKALVGEIGKSIKTWPDMAKAIAKEARKGYVAKDEVTKAQRRLAEKIDTALKGRGMSLKDITGNGGSDLPPVRGGNTRQGTVDWALTASPEELLADRARRLAAASG